jgi:hypothetical protein
MLPLNFAQYSRTHMTSQLKAGTPEKFPGRSLGLQVRVAWFGFARFAQRAFLRSDDAGIVTPLDDDIISWREGERAFYDYSGP